MEYTKLEHILQDIKKNPISVLLISTTTCGVCNVIQEKIEQVIKKYDNVKLIHSYMDEIPAVSGEFNVFSVPAAILFYNEKEVHREARFVDVEHFEFELERWVRFEEGVNDNGEKNKNIK